MIPFPQVRFVSIVTLNMPYYQEEHVHLAETKTVYTVPTNYSAQNAFKDSLLTTEYV